MIGYARAMLRGSGAGGVLDTQTVTTGAIGFSPDRFRGWGSFDAIGTIDDGFSNIYGGADISDFYWDEAAGQYVLKIMGAANSGWTQVQIDGGLILTRAGAAYTAGQWTWATAHNVTTQAFGTGGTSHTCVFS